MTSNVLLVHSGGKYSKDLDGLSVSVQKQKVNDFAQIQSLESFDCVVFNDYNSTFSTAVGNRLADFAEGGGDISEMS